MTATQQLNAAALIITHLLHVLGLRYWLYYSHSCSHCWTTFRYWLILRKSSAGRFHSFREEQ